MTKKGLLMLVLVVFIAGGVFAQSFESMPKNTVTVDVGPTVLGLAFGQVVNLAGKLPFIEEMPDIDASGFGIAAQYERQLLSQISIALRGAYLGLDLGLGYGSTQSGLSLNLAGDMGLKAISAEAHARFYPFAGSFFVGGMVGYGNLAMDLTGTITGNFMGQNRTESLPSLGARNYAKLGARVGWRMDLGSPGGFVFEPSLGYDHAIGLGDSFGERFKFSGDLANNTQVRNMVDNIGKTLDLLDSYVFAGGPRLTLGFGWRF
jgi:hypothetical protein